jgi:hypothetical protein
MSFGESALTAGGGGLVGGAVSYASGGEFGQGFAAGATVGVMGGAGMGLMRANQSAQAVESGFFSSFNQVASGASTMQRRGAVLAGGGLSGMVFGGDRKSHRRGFNQSRGNRF